MGNNVAYELIYINIVRVLHFLVNLRFEEKAAKKTFSGGKSGARGPKKIARRASGPWDEPGPAGPPGP